MDENFTPSYTTTSVVTDNYMHTEITSASRGTKLFETCPAAGPRLSTIERIRQFARAACCIGIAETAIVLN